MRRLFSFLLLFLGCVISAQAAEPRALPTTTALVTSCQAWHGLPKLRDLSFLLAGFEEKGNFALPDEITWFPWFRPTGSPASGVGLAVRF